MTSSYRPITGSTPALVTPMLEDGSVDYPSLRKLIDWHIAEGTDCIGVVGTTGESPTVSMEENCEIIRVAVEQAAGRVPIMAGTGANATSEAIELTRYAKSVGADCHLSVVPYYNRPSQEGIYRHFRAIAEAVDIPVVLYNVPGRTVADVQHYTVMRLAQVSGIVGIKEATGDLSRLAPLRAGCGDDFLLLSGDDATCREFILQGGQGVISVTANVAPEAMQQMAKAALSGQLAQAGVLNTRLMPLHKAMGFESNPIPVKWALYKQGLIQEGIRLPLTTLSTCYHQPMIEAMQFAGVLPCAVS